MLTSLQVTVPVGSHEKCPISVSFVARYGGDRFLLDTLHTMYASLQEQADLIAKSKLSKNTRSLEESAEIAKEKVKRHFSSFFYFGAPYIFCYFC